MKVIKIQPNYPGFLITIMYEQLTKTYISSYFSYLTTHLKFKNGYTDEIITLDKDDVIFLRGKNIKTKSSYYLYKQDYKLKNSICEKDANYVAK